jgi:hypothetical protein
MEHLETSPKQEDLVDMIQAQLPSTRGAIDEDGYQGCHVSWTRQKGIRGPTKSWPTQPEGTSQGGHNRGGLEDNYRNKSYKYGK